MHTIRERHIEKDRRAENTVSSYLQTYLQMVTKAIAVSFPVFLFFRVLIFLMDLNFLEFQNSVGHGIQICGIRRGLSSISTYGLSFFGYLSSSRFSFLSLESLFVAKIAIVSPSRVVAQRTSLARIALLVNRAISCRDLVRAKNACIIRSQSAITMKYFLVSGSFAHDLRAVKSSKSRLFIDGTNRNPTKYNFASPYFDAKTNASNFAPFPTRRSFRPCACYP